MKTKTNKIVEEIEHEKGSGNVFADLGFENPEEELMKSDLTRNIASIINKKKMTQTQVAKILGVDQPRISSLLRGRFDLFSVEMLMHFLQALGQDINIVVKPKPRNRKLAHLVSPHILKSFNSCGSKGKIKIRNLVFKHPKL